MRAKPLTPTQRKILAIMAEHGPAMFPGGKGSRQFHWYPNEFGVVIKAYQCPEYFLKNRGLVALTPMNAPGYWYRLTPEGERRVAKSKAA